MSKTLETLKVVIEASTSPARKELNKFRESLKGMDDSMKEIDKVKQNINKTTAPIRRMRDAMREAANDAMIKNGLKKYSDEYVELTKDIQKAEKEIGKSISNLEAEKKKMETSGNAFADTDDYKAAKAQLDDLQKEYEQLVKKHREWEEIGVSSKMSNAMKELEKQMLELRKNIGYVKGELQDMEDSGSARRPTQEYQGIIERIREMRRELEAYNARKQQMKTDGSYMVSTPAASGVGGTVKAATTTATASIGVLKRQIADTVSRIPYIGKATVAAGKVVSSGMGMARKAFTLGTTAIRKCAGAATSLIHRFKNGVSSIKQTLANFTALSKVSGVLGRGLKTIAMTARFMFASFVIMGAINSAKDSMTALANECPRTNANLNTLKASFSQLKYSMGTAFAPILDVITPALSTLINYLVAATNAIGQFFAALTGQSTYQAAKRTTGAVSSGMSGAAGSADEANKSAKELQKTLLGFDQINKLDDGSTSSSGTGGGGGTGIGDYYSTESVNSGTSNFVNKVKEAWKAADFTEIGQIIGQKINDALNGIPWDSIQETARRIAQSIATFLNGFINEADWNLVGSTLAEGINTAIDFGYTFVTTFDWKQFGKAIADAVDGFFDTVNWAKLGKTFSDGIDGLLESANEFLAEVDWNSVGEDVADFLTNIDWAGLLVDVGVLICNALIAVLDLATGLVSGIVDGLKNADWKKIADDAWRLFASAWELVKKIIEIGIKLLKSGWTTLKNFIGSAVSVGISLAKKGWSTLKKFIGLTAKLTAKIILGKSGWTTIKNWLGIAKALAIKFKLPRIKVKWGEKTIAGFTIKYPNGFSTYAQGGFPEEGPFYMNRGEIAGKFSNGKGVVANNQQITTGIANAVGPAVYSAMMAAMQTSGGRGNISITLTPDSKGLFKIVKVEAENYANATGMSPFPV